MSRQQPAPVRLSFRLWWLTLSYYISLGTRTYSFWIGVILLLLLASPLIPGAIAGDPAMPYSPWLPRIVCIAICAFVVAGIAALPWPFIRHLRNVLPVAVDALTKAGYHGKMLACAEFENSSSALSWLESYSAGHIERGIDPPRLVGYSPGLGTLKRKRGDPLYEEQDRTERISRAILEEIARLGLKWYYCALLDGARMWLYTSLKPPTGPPIGVPEPEEAKLRIAVSEAPIALDDVKDYGYGPRSRRLYAYRLTIMRYLVERYTGTFIAATCITDATVGGAYVTVTGADIAYHQSKMFAQLVEAEGLRDVSFFVPEGCCPISAGLALPERRYSPFYEMKHFPWHFIFVFATFSVGSVDAEPG